MTQQKTYRLSVVMIVKNEAHNLALTLPSIYDWVNEIVIVDSGSTDNSQSIAEQYGAKWYSNNSWPGFGKQKQLAQSYATGDWILALDADEVVTEKLKDSILSITKSKPNHTVYGIRRIDFVFGHAIDSELWPTKSHWRLYPAKFKYNDNMVHESVVLNDAKTEVLQGFLRHNTARNPNEWLTKRLEYAKSWALERHEKTKKVSISLIFFKSIWAFFKQYLFDGRFLKGKYGFVYACLFSQYTFNKYALLYDINKQPDSYRINYQPHKVNITNLFSTPLPKKLIDKKHTLSVVMIVKNEEKHLPACLYSLYEIADEIIILDSGSTDSTKEIATYFSAKWYVNTNWPGFGRQRQIAQSYANGDYVLMIDADEIINQKLQSEIINLLNQPLHTKTVYSLKRLNVFCNTLAHGDAWYSDNIERIYPRAYYQYHPYNVHESLNTEGVDKSIVLSGRIKHFTNDNLYHFLLKNIRYSTVWSNEKSLSKNKKACLPIFFIKSLFSFLKEYLIRGAFLGKSYGLFLSIATAGYTFNKYLMIWNKDNKS